MSHNLRLLAEKYVDGQNKTLAGVANPLTAEQVEQALRMALEKAPLIEAKVRHIRNGSSVDISLSSNGVTIDHIVWRSSDRKRNKKEVSGAVHRLLAAQSRYLLMLLLRHNPLWDSVHDEIIATLAEKCKAAFASVPKEDFDAKKAKNAVEAKANRISAFKFQMKEAVKALLREGTSPDEIRDAIDEVYVESVHEQ